MDRGDHPKPFSQSGYQGLKYDPYGNVDEQATKNASLITTTIHKAEGEGLSDFAKMWSDIISGIQVGLSFLKYTPLGLYAYAADFVLQMVKGNLQGLSFIDNLRLGMINVMGSIMSNGIANQFGAKEIFNNLMEKALHYAALITANVAVSVITAAMKGVKDNAALWGSALAGMAGSVGSALGQQVVLKILLVTALNVGAAAVQGLNNQQLWIVAGINLAVNSLMSMSGNSAVNQQQSVSVGDVMMAFTSGLLGVAVARMFEGESPESQMMSAFIVQAAVQVAGKMVAMAAVMLDLNRQALSHLNELIQLVTSNQFTAGLKQGFLNNLRDAAGVKTISYITGQGAKSIDEQMKDQQAGKREQLLFAQTVMEDVISLGSELGEKMSQGLDHSLGGLFFGSQGYQNGFMAAYQSINDKTPGLHSAVEKSIMGTMGDLSQNLVLNDEPQNTGYMLIGNQKEDQIASLAADKDTILKSLDIEKIDGVSFMDRQEIKNIKTILGNEALTDMAVMMNGKEMVLFFDGDKLKGAAMLNAAGNKEVRSFNFKLGADGKIAVATGKIFRMIGNQYKEVGAFVLAKRGSEEFKDAMAGTKDRINNAEVAAKLDQADSVYTETDKSGNTRQVYMDAQGKALVSESLMSDGSMKMLVYDYDNLAKGVLAQGSIFVGENGKYSSQAAGTFAIKQQTGTAGLNNAGKAIIEALGTGQMSRTVYTETMKNGATRQISAPTPKARSNTSTIKP